ncbi:hypothetical protein HDU84_009115 [Entophlyctis sp. JEL0112]|nr:hypothetical protein HDU84_009115 [Entophlyctis sp. JEL0112]
MTEIFDLCHAKDSLLITATAAYANDAHADDLFLTQCFALEISVHQLGRSLGHCADFAQYILYGGARLSNAHSREVWGSKVLACPHSTYLHFEDINPFLYDLVANGSAPELRNVWIPNIEKVHHNQMHLLEESHRVLCKNRAICGALKIYAKSVNEPEVAVSSVYMSHSTPDAYADAVSRLGGLRVLSRIPRDFNSFFHAYDHSSHKHTQELVSCWQQHPEWPNLVIAGHKSPDLEPRGYNVLTNSLKDNGTNIAIYDHVDLKRLRELQWIHAVHICPSKQEGYGHYINEARSLSSFVLTTNYPPMNELVTDNFTGILIDHEDPVAEIYQGFSPYFISPVRISSEHICVAVERVFEISLERRREMGRQARASYETDTKIMIKNIDEIRNEAKAYLHGVAFDPFSSKFHS